MAWQRAGQEPSQSEAAPGQQRGREAGSGGALRGVQRGQLDQGRKRDKAP